MSCRRTEHSISALTLAISGPCIRNLDRQCKTGVWVQEAHHDGQDDGHRVVPAVPLYVNVNIQAVHLGVS